jgi:competence protein ComEA
MNLIKALLLSLLFTFSAYAAEQININSADAQTMADQLNGIGQAKAEAIVAYREQHGPFKSIEALTDVKGIGLKTIEKNRDLLTIGAVIRTAPTPIATQQEKAATTPKAP